MGRKAGRLNRPINFIGRNWSITKNVILITGLLNNRSRSISIATQKRASARRFLNDAHTGPPSAYTVQVPTWGHLEPLNIAPCSFKMELYGFMGMTNHSRTPNNMVHKNESTYKAYILRVSEALYVDYLPNNYVTS